jgi:integrase
VTGARPSQAARLEVGDLRADELAEAKLLMPRSGKGGGRLRVKKKYERISTPITPALAARLKVAAAGRPHDAALLLWRGERGWGVEPSANYRGDFRAIVAAVGLDPVEVTAYALRHSSIVRMLLAGIPVRLVASLHDTSVTEIERHYSKYISEGAHSDALSRRALLADEPPVADNVVALAR